MSETGKRLEQLGISLPVRERKGTGAVDAVRHGDLLFLSAHLPVNQEGEPVYTGRVGAEVDLDTAYQAARLCGLNLLATIKDYVGELDRIDYFVKVLGLVNCAEGFHDLDGVMDGFSDTIADTLEERGYHARTVMGTRNLPNGNIPVEIEVIVSVGE